jgi:predicted Rossmann fold flavoprotein
MCAIEAGKRHRKVLVLDHANKAGKKILISGGGRCNFTNYTIDPENYLSHNPHFCKSALSRYTQWDFLEMVNHYQIPFHEREHGQLFCDNSAKDILNMLLEECKKASVSIRLKNNLHEIEKLTDQGFSLETDKENFQCQSLVIATGGLSFPTMGATPFGYKVAEQFGLKVWPTSAGLVPFTLQPEDKETFSPLSGIAVDCIVNVKNTSFRENVLFTHRGLSGPAILQISSYWKPGVEISINFLPDLFIQGEITANLESASKNILKTILAKHLPKRLVSTLFDESMLQKKLTELSKQELKEISEKIHDFRIKPNGTEGYRTAEVTLGGVDCDELSSKTMETKKVPGLYFIGEIVDVTGWLGGYNFQWAWASGWCAGQFV